MSTVVTPPPAAGAVIGAANAKAARVKKKSTSPVVSLAVVVIATIWTIPTLTVEAGRRRVVFLIAFALRMRVHRSAIGSVIMANQLPSYQLIPLYPLRNSSAPDVHLPSISASTHRQNCVNIPLTGDANTRAR